MKTVSLELAWVMGKLIDLGYDYFKERLDHADYANLQPERKTSDSLL